MRLSALLSRLDGPQVVNFVDTDVVGVCYDSRKVEPGFLFVAISGFHVDGNNFIQDALQRGAGAILAEKGKVPPRQLEATTDAGRPLVQVPDVRLALAQVSAAFCGHPARRVRVIGVTGTDGKTTTTYLISAILERAGYKTGLLGTVDFKVGHRVWHNDTRQTTPEAPEVQELLAQMVQEKVDYAILECTSHGLALHRVAGCEYDVGVFTNLTSDHLDFHQTREQYRYDKSRLFRMLAAAHDKGIPKTSVLNADDPAFSYMKAVSPSNVLSYGLEQAADVTPRMLELSPWSTKFRVVTPKGEIPITIPLPGRFNVYNALAAISVGVSQRVPLPVMQEALGSFPGVPGRMQRIDRGQPFTVIVDYAHTPEGLTKVLQTLRPLTQGRLLVVYGSAGERDKGRRYGMGKVAADLGDYSVLTNEDPRFEDPMVILDDVEMGIRSSVKGLNHPFVKILDRREAIRFAFQQAKPNDVVLLTGKGHEKCIIIGNERLPWDDSQVAAELLDEMP